MALRSKFFLAFLMMGPVSVSGQDLSHYWPSEDEITRISESKEWLRLLHYRAPFLRKARSDVASEEFFLSPEGRKDPRQELIETLKVALSLELASAPARGLSQPKLCAIPARIDFLKRVFGEKFTQSLARIECTDFEEWKKGLSAKSVSLVYSSAYPNNPASMFGHTFIRLDRKAGGGDDLTREMDLFSYGVNFSASVPADENQFRYAIWGLFGGYHGKYDLKPYYQKLNEYAYGESRDLWEYHLNFSEPETDQLVRHIWELYSSGYFTYYFLDENCSFQMLTLIEAVKPEWNISSGFPLTVVPIASVKKLTEQPVMVDSVSLHPSLRAQREKAYDGLSERDQDRVQVLFRGENEIANEDTAAILDALIYSLNYEKKMNEGVGENRSLLMRSALLARSQRGHSKSERNSKNFADEKRPDLSHGSSRFTFSGGVSSQGGLDQSKTGALGRFSFSAFEHDVLNRSNSFNPFSELKLFRFEFEKLERENFRFREARLVETASFAPFIPFDPQKSWRVALGWGRVNDLPERTGGGVWRADGGYGLGTYFFSRRNLVYGLAAGELEAGSALTKAARFSAGGELGLLLTPAPDRYFIQARALALHDFVGEVNTRLRWRMEVSQAYAFAQNYDVRILLSRNSLSENFNSYSDEIFIALSVMY